MTLKEFKDELNQFPISEDSKVILTELRNRKIRCNRLIVGAIFTLFIEAIIFFKFNFSFYILFQYVFQNPIISFMFIGATVIFIYCLIESSNASKKLELIRKETIDKLNTDWMINEKTQLRDKISEFIKSNINVNIRFKT